MPGAPSVYSINDILPILLLLGLLTSLLFLTFSPLSASLLLWVSLLLLASLLWLASLHPWFLAFVLFYLTASINTEFRNNDVQYVGGRLFCQA